MQKSGIRKAVGIPDKHLVMFFGCFGCTLTRAPAVCVNRNIFNALFFFVFFVLSFFTITVRRRGMQQHYYIGHLVAVNRYHRTLWTIQRRRSIFSR